MQFFIVNLYVFTFYIDIFVVFLFIHRYVRPNSGKVGRNSRRLREVQPLSKQIEDAMQSVNALNTKYDQIAKTLKDLDEAKDKQIVENASCCIYYLSKADTIKITVFKTIRLPHFISLGGYFGQPCTSFLF